MSNIEISKIKIEKKPVATFENLLNKYPFIQPIARELDKIGELSHGILVASAYEDCVSSLISQGIFDKKIETYLIAGIGGALFHDIGKIGIDPKGIMTSKEKMAENSINNDNNIRLDTRSPEQREEQQNHSLVGGYVLLKLIESGIFPKKDINLLKLWSKIAFSHHEMIVGDNHSHYSRVFYPRSDSETHKFLQEEAFVIKLIQLCDTAVAMRETRSYRKKPLDIIEIGKELESYISDEIIKKIRPMINNQQLNKQKITMFRLLLVSQVLKSVFNIDTFIKGEHNFTKDIKWIFEARRYKEDQKNTIPNSDEEAKLTCPILQGTIQTVWGEQKDRFSREIETGLKREYFHLSRN
jgi:hypothetical protein